MLKRTLNYAVKCGRLSSNPVANAQLLGKPNTRKVVADEAAFAGLLDAAAAHLKPILLLAYDTGMREDEILGLRWSQVNLKEETIRLAPQDTKTEEPRVVVLTRRAVEALQSLPRHIRCEHVFVNPKTERPWKDLSKAFSRATRETGLEGLWFHDLRRCFVTNARRRGVPESVVMKLTGHKTRSVFERYNIIDESDLREAVRRIEAGVREDLAEADAGAGMTRSGRVETGSGFGQDLDKVSKQAP